MTLHVTVRDGIKLHYIVEGSGPMLVLTGAPVGIEGFAGLASRLSSEFTVVRHDPRGIGLSTLPATASLSVTDLTDDLLTIVREVAGDEPVMLFGASGGAVVALDLLSWFPSVVTRLVAHEPPLFGLAPGGGQLLERANAAFRLAAIDPQAGAQAFFDVSEALHQTFAEHPRPEPVTLPPMSPAELEKQRFALGRMAPATVNYRPAFDALPPAKLVVAAGSASVGQPARKAAEALAERSGARFVEAPGNHLGMALQPDEFAAWLTALLKE
ncbi:MAG TPA: alpha/beta hydrolase [Steroidobacter sp.]